MLLNGHKISTFGCGISGFTAEIVAKIASNFEFYSREDIVLITPEKSQKSIREAGKYALLSNDFEIRCSKYCALQERGETLHAN